jgi:amidohydrolase
VCDIGPAATAAGAGDRRRPLVALRADLDALAMDDEKDVPYRSKRPGVAHACGHDMHTTVVLGAGLALAELWAGADDPDRDGGRAPTPPGGVRLIFEPAEEVHPAGALAVIADGALEGVSTIYGVHCDPKLEVGRIGVRTGPITAATDQVGIVLRGPGGHTARPQLTVDLVAVAGRLAAELPAIARRHAAPHGDVLLVFGMLHSGDAGNVIPTHATLRGTLRTHDRAAWDEGEAIVRAALAEALHGTGAEYELTYLRGTPPVVNDAAETELVASVGAAVLGSEAVTAAPLSFGGDSFSYYVDRVPGTYVRLGVHDPARAEQLDLHSGAFDVDEGAVDVGIRVLVAAALAALAAHP